MYNLNLQNISVSKTTETDLTSIMSTTISVGTPAEGWTGLMCTMVKLLPCKPNQHSVRTK